MDFKLGAPRYDFSIYLFGKSIESAPLILAALHKMLCMIGLKLNNAILHFKDIVIFVNDKFCFCNDDIKMPLDFRIQLNIDNFTPRIKITFATPLHIKTNNVFVRDDSLVLRDMFSFIHKRKLAIFCPYRFYDTLFCGEKLRIATHDLSLIAIINAIFKINIIPKNF